jgi:hypothetical protein
MCCSTNGDGTFGASTKPAVPVNGSRDVALADVNADGKLDILSATGTSNALSVLLGNGNGTFQAHAETTAGAGTQPNALVVADFTGDGKLDVVTGNGGTHDISFLRGNGNGTFVAGVESNPSANLPRKIVAADFNGDAKLDVAYTDRNASGATSGLYVQLGNGSGGFTPGTSKLAGANPAFLSAGDLNEDGQPDLVTASAGGGSVFVFLNTGAGNFATGVGYATPDLATGTAVADLDGDGHLDVIVGNAPGSGHQVSLFLGTGDGSLGSRKDLEVGAGLQPSGVVASDLNGDGNPDIAAADRSGGGTKDVAAFLATPPTVTLSGPILFGFPPSPTETRSATITNNGPQFLRPGTASLGGVSPGNFKIVSNGCAGKRVAPGASCSVALQYTSQGPASFATLSVPDNAAGSPHVFQVAAPATIPVLPPGGQILPPGAQRDTVPPTVTGYGITKRKFVVGPKATDITGVAAAKRTGTAFTYALSEAATARIQIRQTLRGRVKKGKCVPGSRKLRKAKRCTRTKVMGALTRTSRAGANRVEFTGRIGKKALKRGAYQASLVATDAAGNGSATHTVAFKVVSAKRRPAPRR